MKLSEFKRIISLIPKINFMVENKGKVPQHFHITEIGIVSRKIIDCGGEIREEKNINFQLWYSDDFQHRLSTQKVNDIISLSEKKLLIDDLEIELEYQESTIGRYSLDFDGESFILKSKKTACLAEDKCLVKDNNDITIYDDEDQSSCCSSDSNCC